jgi:hypothetical protein
MPASKAEVAVGSPERPAVRHHGFLGVDGKLRGRALSGTITSSGAEHGLRVQVHVENSGAGHFVPGGLPGRQMLVRVHARRDDKDLAVAEHVYERRLVDASGQDAPFYAASKVASDTRLGPKQGRDEVFDFVGDGTTAVRLEIVWRELSPEIARVIGVPPPPDVVLLTVDAGAGETRDWKQAR